MVGLIGTEEYRRAVDASRLRCRNLNLHPATRNPILRLQQSEVAPRREAFLDALGDIRSETDALAEIALKAGHCLIIADPDCIAIDIRTTPADRDLLELAGIVPGSCWSEKLAGTNGVSLAVENGGVSTVRGRDHFFRSLQSVVCSGAPIRGADGEILGTLSLSCIDRDIPVDYVLAQHLLTQTADRIEARFFARAYASRHVMAPAPGAPRGALLALDETARIVAATRSANARGRERGDDLIGKTLEEAFPDAPGIAALPERMVSVRPVSGRLASDLGEIAGADPAMNRAVAEAENLLAANLPVLILGAPGCGKKQLAEALQRPARRSVRYLDGLAHSTAEDASQAIRDWVRETDRHLSGGTQITLFLSQVDALPGPAQALLAAWLMRRDEEGAMRGPKARFHCVATAEESDGLGSLSAVLATHRVTVPGLRERQDVAVLIRGAHQRLAGPEATITPAAMERLLAHDWPGNLSELENVFAGIVTLHGRGGIDIAQLPQHIAASSDPEESQAPDLEEALRQTRWNVSRAARLMGVSRATINRRIKEAGLARPAE